MSSAAVASEFDPNTYPAAFLEDIEEYDRQAREETPSSDLFSCAQADLTIRPMDPAGEWRPVPLEQPSGDEDSDSEVGARRFAIRSLSQPIMFEAALPFIQDQDYTRYGNIVAHH